MEMNLVRYLTKNGAKRRAFEPRYGSVWSLNHPESQGIELEDFTIYRIKKNENPAGWYDYDNLPPLNYLEDNLVLQSKTVKCYTYYCNPTPWDWKPLYTDGASDQEKQQCLDARDKRGTGSIDNPFRNAHYALETLVCMAEILCISPTDTYWENTCTDYKDIYFRLVVDGTINHPLECDHRNNIIIDGADIDCKTSIKGNGQRYSTVCCKYLHNCNIKLELSGNNYAHLVRPSAVFAAFTYNCKIDIKNNAIPLIGYSSRLVFYALESNNYLCTVKLANVVKESYPQGYFSAYLTTCIEGNSIETTVSSVLDEQREGEFHGYNGDNKNCKILLSFTDTSSLERSNVEIHLVQSSDISYGLQCNVEFSNTHDSPYIYGYGDYFCNCHFYVKEIIPRGGIVQCAEIANCTFNGAISASAERVFNVDANIAGSIHGVFFRKATIKYNTVYKNNNLYFGGTTLKDIKCSCEFTGESDYADTLCNCRTIEDSSLTVDVTPEVDDDGYFRVSLTGISCDEAKNCTSTISVHKPPSNDYLVSCSGIGGWIYTDQDCGIKVSNCTFTAIFENEDGAISGYKHCP